MTCANFVSYLYTEIVCNHTSVPACTAACIRAATGCIYTRIKISDKGPRADILEYHGAKKSNTVAVRLHRRHKASGVLKFAHAMRNSS